MRRLLTMLVAVLLCAGAVHAEDGSSAPSPQTSRAIARGFARGMVVNLAESGTLSPAEASALLQTPLTPLMNLRGRTDANGSLYVTAAAASGSQTPLTPLGNLRGVTDSNGYLYVTLAGGTAGPLSSVTFTNGTSIADTSGSGKLLVTGTTPMLQLGGTTSSFPAAKANGTTFEIKLADDSGFAGIKASSGNFTSTIQTVNGISTAGAFGVPINVAVYETTGNTAAVTNAINYTPASTSSTYEIVGVVNVTAWATPATFTVAVTYKDASGNARTDTALVVRGTGATAAAVTAVDRWYFHFPAIDIDNSGTAITLSTTGTFTGSPVYNLQADLRRTR